MKKWLIPVIILAVIAIGVGAFFTVRYISLMNYDIGYCDYTAEDSVALCDVRNDIAEKTNEYLSEAVKTTDEKEREKYLVLAAKNGYVNADWLKKLPKAKLQELQEENMRLDIAIDINKERMDEISQFFDSANQDEIAATGKAFLDEQKKLLTENTGYIDTMLKIEILLAYNGIF